MIDEFKQSKGCFYLPNKSPIIKGMDPDMSEDDESLDSHGIGYPTKHRPNVF